METINILITGAGAPGIAGTIYSLKNQNEFKVKLIGTDIKEEVVGKYLMDKTYQVPSPSQEFVDTILDICKKEKIHVIIPQVTKELSWLAKSKEQFEKIGVKVLVSDYEGLVRVNNKYELLKACSENGIDCTGKYFLVESEEELKKKAKEIGYPNKPFVVKIVDSSGMRGLRIVKKDFDEYKNFMENKPGDATTSFERLLSIFEGKAFPKLLVSEYFPGEEYSVDVLADKGEMVVCIPRSRDVIRTGISFEGKTVNNEEIIDCCRRIVKALKLDYMLGFQFKKDEEGNFRILESNPRVQGTMVHATFANANVIFGAVKQAIKGESGLSQKDIIWGTKLKRYWGAIGDNEKQVDKV